MNVLFIGGTGIISEACTWEAARSGVELWLFNRGRTKADLPDGVRVINGDVRDRKSAEKALRGMSFDCVVDWIAYEVEHVRADIGMFAGRCGQYIFISSASVYQSPPDHYIVTESTPLSNPYWLYSRKKIECEQALMEAYRGDGFPVTIVRPSSTYSARKLPGLVGCGGWNLVRRLREGRKVIVHGDGTSLWTFTHARDFAKGFAGLLGNMRAVGESFHITSDEVVTWNQLVRMIGRAAGAEPDIVHIPTDFIYGMYPEIAEGYMGERSHSKVFDNSKIKAFVPGYEAKMPLSEGVKECVEWFDAHPEAQVVNEEAERKVEAVLAAYGAAPLTCSADIKGGMSRAAFEKAARR